MKKQKLTQKEMREIDRAVYVLKKYKTEVSQDEEWNTLYTEWEVSICEETGRPVIWGHSTSGYTPY